MVAARQWQARAVRKVSEHTVGHNPAIVHLPCRDHTSPAPHAVFPNRFHILRPMAPLQQITFPLRGEFITLDSLLKACGLAGSGGVAKAMVADGLVQVDGQDELRKTAKIRAGQVVSLTGARIKVVAGSEDDDESRND